MGRAPGKGGIERAVNRVSAHRDGGPPHHRIALAHHPAENLGGLDLAVNEQAGEVIGRVTSSAWNAAIWGDDIAGGTVLRLNEPRQQHGEQDRQNGATHGTFCAVVAQSRCSTPDTKGPVPHEERFWPVAAIRTLPPARNQGALARRRAAPDRPDGRALLQRLILNNR